MKKKVLKRLLIWFAVAPVVVLSIAILVIYAKQDAIVKSQVNSINTEFQGHITVGDVHLAPFSNFPDISLKIEDVVIHERKDQSIDPILDVADIYFGFNLWDLITGEYDIHSLIIEDGFVDLVLHTDGTINLANALATANSNHSSEIIDIHLRKIELKNLDVHQRDEATNLDIETLVYHAKGGFNSIDEKIAAHVDTEFELNVIANNDTTYFKQKHFELHADLTFDEANGILAFRPSGITMEHGAFQIEGSIDTKNDMTLDLSLKGTKPSFDMFIAFAPTEIIPVLERYENAGNIYFNATVQGPTVNGRQPFIDASFGATEAYLENTSVEKRIDHVGFIGHFTNGEERTMRSMEFSITDITANLEKGKFIGNVLVRNFEAPDISMQLNADFDIPFVVDFLNLKEVEDAEGTVEIQLNFHDILDLENPEEALSELDQAYFAELKIEGLAFSTSNLPTPLKKLDTHFEMNGKGAQIDKFNLEIGNSQLSLTGFISDLPAIVHQTTTPLYTQLEIESNKLDIAELTEYSEKDSAGFNEHIENLHLAFSFNALGNAFTDFKHLPIGEFYIDDLYANFKHYPHTLHDFHADILVKDDDLKIVDFTGQIDESDFHFNGLIHDYSFWMQDELNGDVDLDIMLKSDLLKFENLFAYQGENHVPKDYRHEKIEDLELHVESNLKYKTNALQSIDLQLDKLEGKMHVHPLRIENFNGRFHFEDEHLVVTDFKGKMGRTHFDIDMNYYLGEDEAIKKRDNVFSLQSDFIDFDALSNFNTTESPHADFQKDKTTEDVPAHAEVFNLYELPFTDMQFNIDVGQFMYHRIDLKNVEAKLRSTHNHYLYVDTVSVDAAGGHIAMNGYFNGSDPKHIYLKPNLRVNGVDLDKLLFKFENFGQDAVISDNLHGKLTAAITGNVRVYPDFVVDLDRSEVHLDAQVIDGRLENYDPVMMMSDYFGNKDLTRIKFDTLKNHMDMTNGTITVPDMTIESTLGHMNISGTQDMDDNIDYYISIPWSLVKQAARNKIFGTKDNASKTEDEIVELDPNKKIKYLHINITGTLDDYKVKTGKDKSQSKK